MQSRLLILLLSLSCIGHTQSSWRIDKLGIADGLSEGYVYTIHQDKKGFIWIGTHGGLNRYDGYNFKVFQYIPFNPSSLGDNSVFFLKEDSKTGKFWIGGSSCLNEFNPETFENKRYHYTKKQLEFADGVFVNPYEILLACQYDVLLFNTQTKTFTAVPVLDENNQQLSISRVENTAADKKGNFMITSKNGIFFYDPLSKTCKRKTAGSPDFSSFYKHEVFNVLEDSRGWYWVATNKQGLIRFDPSGHKTSVLPLPEPLKNETLRFDIVTEDSRGMIWAGSSNGLFRIDPQTLQSEHFSADIKKSSFLSHSEINVIQEDRNHFMWIGTVGGGINKMIPRNAGFKNYVLANDKDGARTGTYTMAMEQKGSDIWFLNIWDQVGKVNMETGRITLLDKSQLPLSYSWYSEGAIIKNANNEVVILNGENQYRVQEKPGGIISAIASPASGLFLIYPSKNGKTYYMVKASVEKSFCRNDTIYGNHFFYDAKEDKSGNIWIGTSKGLLKYNINDNKLLQFRHNDNDPNSISSDFIYAVETDESSQDIWMAAYNGGLCSYHIPTGRFRHYNKNDGLSDNIVYSIEKDDHGNLWFSSNAGISAYNIKTKSFRNYSPADGLLNNEFNRRVSYKNDQGWIFFGGIFGIDYFHPDSIIKNTTAPQLAFTNFRIFNSDYIARAEKDIPVIDLKHSDRYISVEFASLDYNDQQKIQYAYRFSKNAEWIRIGNQHSLSFSDLATGSHQLYIRSTNSEGNWLDNEISCSIIVHPSWWQTTWFRLAVIVLLAALTILIIRGYYQRKLENQKRLFEKQQAVEHERTRIATDMHDDLGAGLSRIRFLSETIGIKKQQQEPIEEDISKIREYSYDMIGKMGEIVWALNEKNDSLSDLLSYTRAYTVEYLSQSGIHCVVEGPGKIPPGFVSGEFRRNIYLVVKEALHNIVKHALANKVIMRFEAGSHLTITISDNGTGFDQQNTRPFSNGLSNMKKRMQTIKGKLEILSGNGTTIVLTAPLPAGLPV